MKTLALLLLPAAALLTATSCSKDSVKPKPDPAVELGMQRSFHFTADNTHRDTTFASGAMESLAARTSQEMYLCFGPAAGADYINLKLDPRQMPSNFVGTYSLDSNTGAVYSRYLYRRITPSGYSASILSSDAHPTTGTLTISHYDAERKLISGSYTAQFTGVYDPTSTSTNHTQLRRCNLSLSGTFENVKLSVVP
ncbi:hypothetical protein D3Y59_12950 [Hymenobacter oligotrophus]|uniref:Uncharacterized protein n=1 Tax=Hymenobacter oligotrophus TaxID=2319843 RepID=A0A3B7R3G2_9BACT|nr:hypothetical protein [Hymenobacter oligotrophus]AYA37870.1 hypothetical protein D3Y59_12950 [Hymenobacter oligotrophus]